MAISFKTLTQDDKTTSRTLLHEAIPITGTLISGTYAETATHRSNNIKTYSHGMFQSIYDYPYVSSSANHLFDITVGFSTASQVHGSLSSSASRDLAQRSKKVNIYNQMSQVLMGYNADGKVRRFDQDGTLTGGSKYENAAFLNFSRLLVKDEIKKGSFSMVLGSGSFADPWGATVTITDADAANSYNVNSPAGEYGILKAGATAGTATVTITNHANLGADDSVAFKTTSGVTITATGNASTTTESDTNSPTFDTGNGSNNATATELAKCLNANSKISAVADGAVVTITQATAGVMSDKVVTITAGGSAGMTKTDFVGDSGIGNAGLIYYQAGIVVLSPESSLGSKQLGATHASSSANDLIASESIDRFADGLRRRIKNISFNNTTELNSSIFFCRANFKEFNYSANPTYLTGSKIRVKSTGDLSNERESLPLSYVTTVGLYSPKNELLAVAKLSEPLRKDPTNELTLRVRLDY